MLGQIRVANLLIVKLLGPLKAAPGTPQQPQRCWKASIFIIEALMHMNRALKPINTAAAGPMNLYLSP